MKKLNVLILIVFLVSYLCRCKKDNYTNLAEDIDGKVYHTVNIGTQVWMAENMITTKDLL